MTTHKGTDGSYPWDRMEVHGTYTGFAAENLAFGTKKGDEYIYTLYVDDGNWSRKHRKNIVHPGLKLTGMAYCPHSKYGHILVINYASGFIPTGSNSEPVI